jgi:hypothetical protein
MSKNSPLIINFKRKSILAPKDQTIQSPKTKKRRGPKKWLDKELFFSVDPSKIKYYSIGKTTTLIPLKERRKNKTVKIAFCWRDGTGILKASKIEFSKAIRS